ncbi:MAG: thioredoxin-dependent thiol peroxidase [Bacteroidetes bacterium]|nr:MAG: thioredoxin-dependent thiol peroxidase [Bacteroidota bacterium]
MTHLNEGDIAPQFETIDEQGNTIKLSDYKGKKLILFSYPKAMTPGCTAEACNLSDNYELLKSKGFEILGISADDTKKQIRFKEKYNFPYPLIPDTEKEILKLYGIWGPKKLYGREYDGIHRTTFIIDEEGKIEKIFKKVKTKEHTAQILAEY